jgi:rhodanese-related sulfurtransferase
VREAVAKVLWQTLNLVFVKNFLLFFILFVTANSFAQKSLDKLLETHNSQSIPYISVTELRMLQLNGNVAILDAREPEEFKVSHINGAQNVGYNDFSPEEKSVQKLKKSEPVIVYCSVGIRSEKIGEKLKKAGFTNVRNLYGGIFEWKNKGFPVIDSTGKKTDNIHIYGKMWGQYLSAGNPVY